MKQKNTIVYNKIGIQYNRHRKADKRILQAFLDLLDLPAGSTIADIGAGTGNYSYALAEAGYNVKAVEPSIKMRTQTTPLKKIIWIDGRAESIPMPDNSVDGIVVMLAIHHFSSVDQAATEFSRICSRGPIVIFTFDPRECSQFWFTEYFPEIWRQAFHAFPPIKDFASTIAEKVQLSYRIQKFQLPGDLSDLFMAAAWNRPKLFLDAQIRQSMSGFALAQQTIVHKGIQKLKRDLESGTWDNSYGYLRKQREFDAGYRFISLRKTGECCREQ